MELSTGPIQHYQKNQNLAGWVQQNEGIQDSIGLDAKNQEEISREIFISPQRKIFDWIASEFPVSLENAATVNLAGQALYDYQILNFSDLNTINKLIAESPDLPILEKINSEIDNNSSFQEFRTLIHLKQVFETLVAAEMQPAA